MNAQVLQESIEELANLMLEAQRIVVFADLVTE